jgi:hypothetical protein
MPGWSTRWISVIGLAAAVGLGPSGARAERLHGAVLPREVRPAGSNRFASAQTYPRTLRWFRRTYGRSEGIFFRPLRGSPKVQGVFIQNLRPGRAWDGINLYEAEGTVHIYVLPAQSP